MTEKIPKVSPIESDAGIDLVLFSSAIIGAYQLFPDVLRTRLDGTLTEEEIEHFADMSPLQLGSTGLCEVASEALVRSSVSLGLPARVELHMGHAVVNFSDPDKNPSDDDIIADLTWGQFNKPKYEEMAKKDGRAHPYLGKRSNIRPLLPKGSKRTLLYAFGYAPQSIVTTELYDKDGTVKKIPSAHHKSKKLGLFLLAKTAGPALFE